MACSGSVGVPYPGWSQPSEDAPPVPGAPDTQKPPGMQTDALCTADDVGASELRRLSNLELQLTLQDLFQLAVAPGIEGIPDDNAKHGFKTFADVQTMSPAHLSAYLELAGRLMDGLLADSTRRARVIGCTQDCLPGFVQRFGRLAFRRALTSDELTAVVGSAEANALDANDQLRYAAQLLLASPQFLYRIEGGSGAMSTLSGAELATRLSFALWGRGPSGELLELAEQGALDDPARLRSIVEDMLADARSASFYRAFFRQWLGYEALRSPAQPPADFADTLLPMMQAETDAVLARAAFEDGQILDALTSDDTTLTPQLASYYGLPAPAKDGALTIPSEHVRHGAGLLGHASLMSAKSDGDAVALRGNWVRRTFFCQELAIPPDVAAQLGDLLVGLTRVEIVKQRNEQASCKGCHALIDPIGVGLSSFDQTGRWDAKLDPSEFGITPVIPDLARARFDSPAELAAQLRDAPQVASCLGEKLFTYIAGRTPDKRDRCALDSSDAAFGEARDFRELLASIVQSPSFKLRRAPSLEQP
jgi:hypothetical protein